MVARTRADANLIIRTLILILKVNFKNTVIRYALIIKLIQIFAGLVRIKITISFVFDSIDG